MRLQCRLLLVWLLRDRLRIQGVQDSGARRTSSHSVDPTSPVCACEACCCSEQRSRAVLTRPTFLSNFSQTLVLHCCVVRIAPLRILHDCCPARFCGLPTALRLLPRASLRPRPNRLRTQARSRKEANSLHMPHGVLPHLRSSQPTLLCTSTPSRQTHTSRDLATTR